MIKSLKDFLCIAEEKSRNIKIGYAQNLAQLESAFQTNKKKQTLDQVFGNGYFDYIYGIVTTGTEWHFIIYTLDGSFPQAVANTKLTSRSPSSKKILNYLETT
ncbi:hypothetical protein GLOIN_2v1561751 [Rhizophagus clarus]|uniref:Uncharacterized protein n=1 Tax=Rhizophagus clarus TaxID=94130 RepID=A0A8H3LAG9_9GLOM|nr:hypothetical protein GLOIN_2v1561751 [Rhizophagus clarus]